MSALLIIKIFHLLGFAGCLLASATKTVTLRTKVIRGAALNRLVIADKVSGLSSVVIVLTGLSMALWLAKPTAIYTGSAVFWFKIALFVAASSAVIATKPMLRRAREAGVLHTPGVMRVLLAFDLVSVITMASLGRWIASTL